MNSNADINNRPDYDHVIQDIADYVINFEVSSEEALNTARNCLMDTVGCGLLALRFPECTKHLGPIVQGTVVPNGARVPGTSLSLDPVKAAWDIGCIIRTHESAIRIISKRGALANAADRDRCLQYMVVAPKK